MQLLQIYILGLIAVAAIVYIYRSLAHGNFAKRHAYTISNIIHKSDIIELHLSSNDPILKQKPGQFAFIKMSLPGFMGESHPFTISSQPDQAGLRFSIKQLGDYTSALNSLKPGAEIMIDAPYGTFSNQIIKAPRQIWVAGGIGITPFLAMAGTLQDTNQIIDLYYSVQTKDQAAYLNELQTDAKQYANLRLIPFYTDQNGYLTAEVIQKTSGQFDNQTVFLICGPPPMMKALRRQLRELGVANKAIHTEEFSLS
jgi:predicted ferric reductase